MAPKSINKKLQKAARARVRRAPKYIEGPHPRSRGAEKSVSLDVINACRSLTHLKEKVEYKSPVPAFRGLDACNVLSVPHPGFLLRETKESDLLRTSLSRLFAGKQYRFRITTALNMASSGTGIVNSVIANNAMQSTGDFSALSGVFSEFFIKTMSVKWQPVSRYNYPLSGALGTNVSSLPIGVADLQHAQAAYTSMTAATENWRYEHMNTSDPFTFVWTNVERPTSTVAVDVSTGANVNHGLMSAMRLPIPVRFSLFHSLLLQHFLRHKCWALSWSSGMYSSGFVCNQVIIMLSVVGQKLAASDVLMCLILKGPFLSRQGVRYVVSDLDPPGPLVW